MDREIIERKALGLRQGSALTPAIIEIGPMAEPQPAKLFLRVFTRELWREIRPITKTLMLFITLALVGAMCGLGYLAYRDRQQSLSLIGAQGRRVDEQGQRINEQGQKIDGQGTQLSALKEQAARSNQQIFGLQRTDQNILSNLTLAQNLWSTYHNGVCMIAGSYILLDPATGKPFRYPEKTDEGSEAERMLSEGIDTAHPLVSSGNGPVFEVEFVGTGFHVGDGYVLTNNHIAHEPWKVDMRAHFLIPLTGGKPRLQRLLAFFPGRPKPYNLIFKRASDQIDLSVCRLEGKGVPTDIPALPLDKDSQSTVVGKPVVMMGYPSGPNRMLALLPEEESIDLQEDYGDSLVALLTQLGRLKLIKPLTTQGHITDLYKNQIVFDAGTAEGSSGSPMFGESGRVIGITFAILIDNKASNFAAPAASAITLLEGAGWRQKAAEGA